MPNKCWNCKHDILKLKVLVPPNHTIQEYVHHIDNFQSDIVAVVKEKHGQYTVWFRSGGDLKLVTFKMLHICKLKVEDNTRQVACPYFLHAEEHNYISDVTYSKQPNPEVKKEGPTSAYLCSPPEQCSLFAVGEFDKLRLS